MKCAMFVQHTFFKSAKINITKAKYSRNKSRYEFLECHDGNIREYILQVNDTIHRLLVSFR